MITTTHVVTNALLARRGKAQGQAAPIIVKAGWFIAGGLAPDVGLTLLSAGAAVYFPLVENMTRAEALEHAFSNLFFNDWRWISVQNTLHSPVVLGAMYGLGRLTKSKATMAFALGCLLHTTMDIPVHHDDGPLVLFPLNWDFRVESPVSYWDRDHYAAIVAPIDLAVTVIGGASLAWRYVQGRRETRS